MFQPIKKSVFALAGGLVAATGCGGAELNGDERQGLSPSVGVYDADIAPRRMVVSGSLEPGLWITVHNDLPVIRQDGQIVSQAFLEAEVAAWEPNVEGPERDADDQGGEGRGRERQRQRERHERSFEVRYALRARVLSESETSFWLSPEQLDALVKKSGGRLAFSIKDSVQVGGFPYPCWMGGSRILHHVRSSGEESVQHLTIRVEGRYRLSYKCSLSE